MGMIDEWLIAETATYVSLCRPISLAQATLCRTWKALGEPSTGPKRLNQLAALLFWKAPLFKHLYLAFFGNCGIRMGVASHDDRRVYLQPVADFRDVLAGHFL